MLGEIFWNIAPGLGVTIAGLVLVLLMKILKTPPPPEEQAEITPEQENKIVLVWQIGQAFGWIVAFAGLFLAALPLIETAKQLFETYPALIYIAPLVFAVPVCALFMAMVTGRR